MFTARTKITRKTQREPSALELEIGQALLDLESSSDLKHKALFFQAAKEVEIKQGKKSCHFICSIQKFKKKLPRTF